MKTLIKALLILGLTLGTTYVSAADEGMTASVTGCEDSHDGNRCSGPDCSKTTATTDDTTKSAEPAGSQTK